MVSRRWFHALRLHSGPGAVLEISEPHASGSSLLDTGEGVVADLTEQVPQDLLGCKEDMDTWAARSAEQTAGSDVGEQDSATHRLAYPDAE